VFGSPVSEEIHSWGAGEPATALWHKQNFITNNKIVKKSTFIMGNGTLNGAYAPPIASFSEPAAAAINPIPTKRFQVTIPAGMKPGGEFKVTIAGAMRSLKVPSDMTAGGKMIYSIPDLTKVYTSTLPALPGMTIVLAKPVAFGSVAFSYHSHQVGPHICGPQPGDHVGRLMQEAQEQLMRRAVDVDCNAILGLSFTVTNDSWGEYGNQKLVIVTACGTPCVVTPQIPSAEGSSSNSNEVIPVLQATAVVDPAYLLP
jgi:hypothetical protein